MKDKPTPRELKDLIERQARLEERIKALEKGEEWPKEGDVVWYISFDGLVLRNCCFSDGWDDVGGFLGLYRTEEEATAARDKIREYAQKVYRGEV